MPASLGADLYLALIQALVAARMGANVRQVEFADRLGKPQSFVSKYENRECVLDVAEFLVVAQALGVDPLALIARAMEDRAQSS